MYGIRIAKVAVSDIVYCADKLFSYIIPDEFEASICVGSRVIVPFGIGNRQKNAVVMEIDTVENASNLKKIIRSASSEDKIGPEFIKLAGFMKARYFCTLYDAVKIMLPSGMGIKFKEYYFADVNADTSKLTDFETELYEAVNAAEKMSEDVIKRQFGEKAITHCKKMVTKGILHCETQHKRKVGDKTVKIVTLAKKAEEIEEIIKNPKLKDTHKQVLKLLLEGELSEKELMYLTGLKKSVLATLFKKGYITYFEERFYRQPETMDISGFDASKIKLTNQQQEVFEKIKEKTDQGFGVSLLRGVTGSGKTLVFIALADYLISKNKSVIVLVPEISLTSQMVVRFQAHYSNKVALLHSGLSAGERLDQWQKIKNGMCNVVIGTRSAVFAPVKDLGMIIIDEEQEHTYKSEMSPRYSTKDIAKFRCNYNGASLLLASATPSIESYYNAKVGKYSLYELDKRFNESKLPQVTVVDMRQELKNGNMGVISDRLRDEIAYNLENKQQTILFINRRGFNSNVSCRSCGYVAVCPNCNISLTYHSVNNRLMCHYCGYSIKNEQTCPQCSEKHFKYLGTGTQKIQAELEILFPQARIIRMDADTTTRKSSYNTIITDFQNFEYDILVGTQMVTKGLDFKNVTLAGVISADQSLYSDDFRANEKTFSLLTQITGRAGRGDLSGRAVIQTYNPDHKILNLAFTQDYKAFYEDEIQLRKSLTYPPFCDLCQILFEGDEQENVQQGAKRFTELLCEKLSGDFSDVPIKGYGPVEASIPKLFNKYRYRLLLKCKNNSRFRGMMSGLSYDFSADRRNSGITAIIDINPEIIL